MILADTSVWIDYFNGYPSREANYFDNYIEQGKHVLICPVIIQEILQGISSDKEYSKVKKHLLYFPLINAEPLDVFIGAADIYRKLRKKGITIRKSNDCLIAWYAVHSGASILQKDRDFPLMKKHIKINLVEI
jgi:predicted nucleic acid-binding protein